MFCTHTEKWCYNFEIFVLSRQQVQQQDQNRSYWISSSVILLIAFSYVRTNLSAFLKIVLHLQSTRLQPLLAVPPCKEPTLAPQPPARQSPGGALVPFTGHQACQGNLVVENIIIFTLPSFEADPFQTYFSPPNTKQEEICNQLPVGFFLHSYF